MSITETPDLPKLPHKRANKRRRPAKTAAPKHDGEFDGLTVKNCPASCAVGRCVISGIAVCAHPLKGGIQAAQKHDAKVLARFARAKAALGD